MRKNNILALIFIIVLSGYFLIAQEKSTATPADTSPANQADTTAETPADAATATPADAATATPADTATETPAPTAAQTQAADQKPPKRVVTANFALGYTPFTFIFDNTSTAPLGANIPVNTSLNFGIPIIDTNIEGSWLTHYLSLSVDAYPHYSTTAMNYGDANTGKIIGTSMMLVDTIIGLGYQGIYKNIFAQLNFGVGYYTGWVNTLGFGMNLKAGYIFDFWGQDNGRLGVMPAITLGLISYSADSKSVIDIPIGISVGLMMY